MATAAFSTARSPFRGCASSGLTCFSDRGASWRARLNGRYPRAAVRPRRSLPGGFRAGRDDDAAPGSRRADRRVRRGFLHVLRGDRLGVADSRRGLGGALRSGGARDASRRTEHGAGAPAQRRRPVDAAACCWWIKHYPAWKLPAGARADRGWAWRSRCARTSDPALREAYQAVQRMAVREAVTACGSPGLSSPTTRREQRRRLHRHAAFCRSDHRLRFVQHRPARVELARDRRRAGDPASALTNYASQRNAALDAVREWRIGCCSSMPTSACRQRWRRRVRDEHRESRHCADFAFRATTTSSAG